MVVAVVVVQQIPFHLALVWYSMFGVAVGVSGLQLIGGEFDPPDATVSRNTGQLSLASLWDG